MDQYINQTQTLYDLAGARSFVFLTVPPIQYSPTVLAQGAENVAAEGKAVTQYNEALTKRVEAFAKANARVKVKVVDTVAPFMEAINDPKAFGAVDATCFDASGTRCLWWNDVSFLSIDFAGDSGEESLGLEADVCLTVSSWSCDSPTCC
jgi:phospholipase/lecithinase/hemolysin